MGYKLIETFEKYNNKNKLDKFYRYIEKNNLKDQFMKEALYEALRPKKGKDYTDLLKCSLNLSLEELEKGFGEKNAKRIIGLLYKGSNINTKMSNLIQLTNIVKDRDYTGQEDYINDILDMVSQEGMTVGTHIIGTDYGETLKQEGILLTGHKFVTTDRVEDDATNDVKGILSRNVTFFENAPIDAFLHIFQNRGYNNRQRGGANDIMIVSIPTEQLQQNKSDIIIEKQDSKYLNPQYISGYVRINVENAQIENVKHDGNISQSKSTEEWEKRFVEWNRQTSTSKLAVIKDNIIKKLKNLLTKTKSLPEEKDR